MDQGAGPKVSIAGSVRFRRGPLNILRRGRHSFVVGWRRQRVPGLGEVMDGLLVGDLRGELARGEVIVLVGAGVSVAATGRAPVASWPGLLEDGVARCEELELRPLPAG